MVKIRYFRHNWCMFTFTGMLEKFDKNSIGQQWYFGKHDSQPAIPLLSVKSMTKLCESCWVKRRSVGTS